MSAKGCVDGAVVWAMRKTSIRQSRLLDALEDDFKLGFGDSKAVVLLRNGFVPLIEVDRQVLADLHRRERADRSLLCPGHTEQRAELPR